MEYPLISEYKDAILAAEDNFNELSSLRPVLDDYGNPVMSSGNFAVVFKMKDENDGKLYAVKCFIKDQVGRDESYKKIADELEMVSSSYILPLRYMEKELFVDTDHCYEEEFPVVVMEWVEGETLDAYLNRNLHDQYELEMLSYRFNRMAAWLLAQPFAHGDLKPDNILVRKDGSLVLVDYDGMFVPSMKGEKAREIGSPDYRHPSRSDADFDEHIDDFSIAVIALSLKAIAINPSLKSPLNSSDTLLLGERDFQDPAKSTLLKDIISSSSDAELSRLLSSLFMALANNSLDMRSFRLFMTNKPTRRSIISDGIIHIDASVTDADIAEGVIDASGVIYSKDGLRLLRCTNTKIRNYTIKPTSIIICENAFQDCHNLQYMELPNSVTEIGKSAFSGCEELKSVVLYGNVKIINDYLFIGCKSLQTVEIPSSVTKIGRSAFWGCIALQSVVIPNSVTEIGMGAFWECISLQSIMIPNSVTEIASRAFQGCKELESVVIPNSVTSIGDGAFLGCKELKNLNIPDNLSHLGSNPFEQCQKLELTISSYSNFKIINKLLISNDGRLISCLTDSPFIVIPSYVTSIGNRAFSCCENLQNVSIPNSVINIGEDAFLGCEALQRIVIPDSVDTISDGMFWGCRSLGKVDIPDSVRTIGEFAFHKCESIENLVIPNSVTAIGDGAFELCKGLKQLNIPPYLIHFGINPFENCFNLSTIISSSNYVIINRLLIDSEGVLISCLNNSSSIEIPTGVSSIRENAFAGCSALQKVTIPNSVTAIHQGAFFECSALQNIELPDSVSMIGERTFLWCTSLTYAIIPNSLDIIGKNAFPENCQIIRRKSNS